MVNRTRILSIAGALLTLALVGYVIYQGSLALDEQKENLLNSDFYGWGLAALLFTTASALVLPFAYVHILASVNPGGAGGNGRQVWSIYALTQIYKYLPGNVFHFVGRQLAVRKLGFSDGAIANSSIIEMLSLGLAAGLCVLAAGNFTLAEILAFLDLTVREWQHLGLAIALALAAVTVVTWYFRKFGIRLGAAPFLKLLLLYLCYFLLAAIGLLLLLRGLDITGANLFSALAIFALAWLLGTAMPGASAGIGVREAVIVALGHGLLDANLAVAAMVLRILTVAADVVTWGIGTATRSESVAAGSGPAP